MTGRPHHLLATLLPSFLLATALLLPSCSKFESKPADNDSILFKVNDAPTTQSTGTLQVQPLPLPRLQPGTPQARPLLRSPDAQPELVVPPYEGPPQPAPRPAPPSTPRALGGQATLADVSTPPYSSGGKLIFTFPSDAPGYGHSCTAQFIGSQGVILTAAHCVWDTVGKAWANSIAFDQQYASGAATHKFDWQCAAIASGWVNGSYAHDYALIKLRGVPTTGLGLQINTGAMPVDAIGYPINLYDAQRMVHVLADKDANNPSAMLSEMSHGASGGAWINGGNAVSVNSFKYTNDDAHMYGPVLSATTQKLFAFVANGCSAQAHAMGAAILAADPTTADTVMTPATEDLDTGTRLATAPGDACTCGDKAETTLENATDEPRIVGIQHVATDGDGAKAATSLDFLTLRPGERRSLGCVRTSSASGGMCTIDHTYRTISDRRFGSQPPALPDPRNRLPLALSFAGADANRCTAACASNDPSQCLRLGQASIPALAPLGRFIERTNDPAPAPDGVLVTRSDIITQYGGDPATAQDPCGRSDVERRAGAVTNSGLACLLTTRDIYPQNDLRTRLTMRADVRGYPSAWTPSLAALLPAGPATLFPDRQTAPAIDFQGTGGTGLNRRFGGDIHAITTAPGNDIVVSTGNGCIIGPYKK